MNYNRPAFARGLFSRLLQRNHGPWVAVNVSVCTMFRFIAFLRAINVGRGRQDAPRVRVAWVFKGSYVHCQRNVMFETTINNTKRLERKIQTRLREALGYEGPTFIRRKAGLAKIANYQPFRQSKLDAAVQINTIFLADRLDQKVKQKVSRLRTNTDAFEVHGREIYWLRRRKQSGAPFSTVPLRRLSVGHSPSAGLTQSNKIASKYCSSKTC
jgi:uncharacterized protein (DUF1697 family)